MPHSTSNKHLYCACLYKDELFKTLRIIDLHRQTHMHICEHFITIHNEWLGLQCTKTCPVLKIIRITCKGPNMVHPAWCCFIHYPLLKHFLSLHNKPQGLVNWCRKTHEKINAKLISCYMVSSACYYFHCWQWKYQQLSDFSNNLWFWVFLNGKTKKPSSSGFKKKRFSEFKQTSGSGFSKNLKELAVFRN